MPIPCLHLVAVAAALIAGPAADPAPPSGRPGFAPAASAEKLVRIDALADAEAIAPGGTVRLAVTFDIAAGWHIYWRNSGDTGAPTEVTVRAAAGFTVGPVEFPRPRSFTEDDATTFGYEREAVLFVPVTAGPEVAAGPARFEIDVFFLACRQRCLIGRATRTLALPVLETGAVPAPAAGPVRTRIERFRRRVPAPLTALAGATARYEGGRLVVSGPAAGFASVRALPLTVPGVGWSVTEARTSNGRFRLEVPLELRPQNAEDGRWRVEGVIALGTGLDDPSYHFSVALPPPITPAPPAAP